MLTPATPVAVPAAKPAAPAPPPITTAPPRLRTSAFATLIAPPLLLLLALSVTLA